MDTIFLHHARLAVTGDRVTGRRDFLRSIPVAGLATGALAWTDVLSANADELRRQGRACILLWMSGGPSQLETFDAKPGHANGGETQAIATRVPGITLAESLPHLARCSDRLAIIRSMRTREGEHQRADHLMHTAYLPLSTVQYPTLGAVVGHELPNPASELPPYIRIGGPQGQGLGGFLGRQYDAFWLSAAGRVPENARPATETERFQRRLGMMRRLHDAVPSGVSPASSDHPKLYDQAARMILGPGMQAFDLEREPGRIRDAYGRTPFGTACLLARRLVEAGVPCVETVIPGWDTHENNFSRTRDLCTQLDAPFAYLLTDLQERGLLETTLVIWMGEFGRTPRINPKAGRDHFPGGFSVVLAGGGIRGGAVVGATDAGGETIKDRPVSEKDLFQTVYKALRIDAQAAYMTPVGRPIKLVDGGHPVDELLL